jgi:hypothetical protein
MLGSAPAERTCTLRHPSSGLRVAEDAARPNRRTLQLKHMYQEEAQFHLPLAL